MRRRPFEPSRAVAWIVVARRPDRPFRRRGGPQGGGPLEALLPGRCGRSFSLIVEFNTDNFRNTGKCGAEGYGLRGKGRFRVCKAGSASRTRGEVQETA